MEHRILFQKTPQHLTVLLISKTYQRKHTILMLLYLQHSKEVIESHIRMELSTQQENLNLDVIQTVNIARLQAMTMSIIKH